MTALLSNVSIIGRLLLGGFFLLAGINKISAYAGTVGYMEAFGVAGILLPLVILLEVAGGIAIIAGFYSRIVAIALAGFSLISGVIFHFAPEDQMQMIMMMKNFAIAGGFLMLAANGPGKFSMNDR